MARILIAEEEILYRQYLVESLTEKGHEIKTCLDSRDALKIYQAFIPDLLIANCDFKNRKREQHIARFLQSNYHDVQVILISDEFVNQDLLEELSDESFAVISKSYNLDELISTVDTALSVSEKDILNSNIGFLELGPEGEISSLNNAARNYLNINSETTPPSSIKELPLDSTKLQKGLAGNDWFKIKLKTLPNNTLFFLGLDFSDKNSRMLAVLDEEHEVYMKNRTLWTLTHPGPIASEDSVLWPFDGEVVLIDSDPKQIDLSRKAFEDASVKSFHTTNIAEAISYIQENGEIRFILLEDGIINDLKNPAEIRSFIHVVKNINPEIDIIGYGSDETKETFIKLGIELCLNKPWDMNQLINFISQQ